MQLRNQTTLVLAFVLFDGNTISDIPALLLPPLHNIHTGLWTSKSKEMSIALAARHVQINTKISACITGCVAGMTMQRTWCKSLTIIVHLHLKWYDQTE